MNRYSSCVMVMRHPIFSGGAMGFSGTYLQMDAYAVGNQDAIEASGAPYG